VSSRPIIWLLCAGAVGLACNVHARSSDAVAGDTTVARTVRESARESASRSTAPRHLASSLDVTVAQRVSFRLRTSNETDKHIEVHFPNGQTHDFAVVDSAGHEIWRWGKGRLFTSSLQTKLIDAHDKADFEESWDAAGRHGTYTVIATLRSSDFPIEKRAQFVLP
jgi:hypothetical protein